MVFLWILFIWKKKNAFKELKKILGLIKLENILSNNSNKRDFINIIRNKHIIVNDIYVKKSTDDLFYANLEEEYK